MSGQRLTGVFLQMGEAEPRLRFAVAFPQAGTLAERNIDEQD